ncbi:MAG: helix-turn-helix transcriptional regulator [Ekhidna sp.]|nr:helix-turn-helix transcriptional regulator [Ekhidna sp.]
MENKFNSLSQWRKSKKLSSADAAKLFGISQTLWSYYESGERRVTAERVIAISSLTGIPKSILRPDIYPNQEPAE